jgi:two-component system sensor histidine kinase TctE
VTVRVHTSNDRSRVLLEIEDNGPGIPTAERVHVFDRFYRILGSDTEGSGLGLAIVKEIATRHAADIEVIDNPHGRGCLFRISLMQDIIR